MFPTEFALALAAFVLSHMLPLRPPLRPWLEARLGRRGFTTGYSLLSTAILVWLIGAAGRAPRLILWDWAPWQNHVVLVVMLPACLVVALSIGRPNPFSFGGSARAQFDPARPGIVGYMRHPLLVAMALWALAHLLANGDLVHAILFASFAGLALLGGRLVDRRFRRQMGSEWDRIRAAMAAGGRPGLLAILRAHPLRVLAGLALYGGLILLHPVVLGPSPLP